ncbi:agamous-like MADS-box protein AGL15 isoform X1 [Camellia sinensis]|uniref:agamous-like MADS-box protein AGL15 isoform X1 n=1 Tax=Camellia sinensis TaxID=4442 RepID=UPI001036EFF3|nr:agamous-like MADS-box protein AGL15 isoform X1 [Camellia sinensis]
MEKEGKLKQEASTCLVHFFSFICDLTKLCLPTNCGTTLGNMSWCSLMVNLRGEEEGIRWSTSKRRSMNRTLSRYNKCLDSSETALVEHEEEEHEEEKQEFEEVDILKDEIANLKVKQMQLLGKDLIGLSLKELHHLEEQLNEGLLSVKEKKEQLLMEQLEQSRVQEQRAMLENETLRRQVQELRNFLPLCEHSGMPYQEYFPAERNNSLLNHGAASPDTVHNCAVDLQLGLSSEVSCKRKAPEKENRSSNSGSQMSLL